MGKPLCVLIYHIMTEDPDVSVEELEQLASCPSQYVMDNVFYYGEYEVIGNRPLPERDSDIDYPILYGRSIDARDRDKICYCRGGEVEECLKK